MRRPRADARHVFPTAPRLPARSLVVLLALLTGLPALALPPAARAQATEFFVTSTLDQPDADLADDICDADPGPALSCTLRAAVLQATVSQGEHIIRLQPALYRLTITGAGEDQGRTGDLDLRGTITIIGTTSGGRLRSTVDATGLNDRVFDVRQSATATLQGLTVSGGAPPPDGVLFGGPYGGGIQTQGTALTLLDSTVRNNTALYGGGIASLAGTTTITRSTITNNSATNSATTCCDGGGMFVYNSVMTLLDSTVHNNTSARDGGGMQVLPDGSNDSPIRVQRSLIVGNTSKRAGGGVAVDGEDKGQVVIDNSTLSANQSARGGGISATELPVDKAVAVRASTIAGNSADDGGGLYTAEFNAFLLTNVVLSNNLGLNCNFNSSAVPNSTFNLSSDGRCFNPSLNNFVNTNAKLGSLQFNGGPTRTHALLEGSPAIDGGVSFASIFDDQRGAVRVSEVLGGNRFDIGAFEFNGFGVGEFSMTAPASALAEQPVTVNAGWVHPVRWRNLDTVELQLRAGEALAARVVYTEGITDTVGISVTDGLALYNSDGSIAGVGTPGEARVLESDTALLDLGATTLQGSGAEGKSVTLSLALRLKSTTAGRMYTTTILASDDQGRLQGPHDTGTLALGPFRSALPLVAR